MECPSKSDGANTWRSIFRVYRGVVLKVLVKKGRLGIHFLKKRDPNQTGNLHYGHFGDRYSEQLPNRV